ncbi:MAG: hypothetical protein EXS37_00045 [Opitutus sp.]|nr:hypothetical protein [Opitutus sp.]
MPCPRCQRTLGPESWSDAHGGTCFRCKTDYEFVAFPALTATPTQFVAQAAVVAADSVCYFHPENRAETVCEGCGRLLCPICHVPFAGRKLCPTCIAGTRTSQAPTVVRERMLYDGIALALAGLPLLVFPITLVTAPVAVGAIVYGWNKPGSLVRGRSRARLIIAAILAGLQIAGWIAFLIFQWLKR